MTINRTPHGTAIPGNINLLGRPPHSGPLNARDVEFLSSPDLVARLEQLKVLDPVAAQEVLLNLRQHRRVLDSARSLPGEWNGRDDQPHQPMPFQPREVAHPLRQAHTPDGAAMRKAVETIDATLMTRDLTARMRSHDPDSSDSLWNRMAPASERATSSSSEPTLRDRVEAAASLKFEE